MKDFNINEHPHRRYNPLLDEYVLVSPHRANRPWQGQKEKTAGEQLPEYDPACYLCPGNTRTNGDVNDKYTGAFVFDNDFPSLLRDETTDEKGAGFFKIEPERGVNRVICFSPKHNVTLPLMSVPEISEVVKVWISEYLNLGKLDYINHVQIFENKGAVMGCSNPHPHCQVWAQKSVPSLVQRTQTNLKKYFDEKGTSLLADYLNEELQKKERVVVENQHFAVIVPFWAVWPFETMIISKRHFTNISEMSENEIFAYSEILKILTTKYDNLFETSFPYSAGIHQAPTDGKPHPEWHFHHHFYPPLLRSATVKKFMVGYELLAEAQRDITAEKSAAMLRELSDAHYKTL